jgi:hypothetical protein
MAFTKDNVQATSGWGEKRITYSATAATVEASPGEVWSGTHITIQVTGTLGAGLSIDVEASNDGGNTWAALPTAVTLTALGLEKIALANHGFEQYRFSKTAGHASTDLNIYVVTGTP